jgi:hypothetical protein
MLFMLIVVYSEYPKYPLYAECRHAERVSWRHTKALDTIPARLNLRQLFLPLSLSCCPYYNHVIVNDASRVVSE